MISEAGLLPGYPNDIRSRATPGLSDWYPKPGCSPTIWQLSEVGLLSGYPAYMRSRAITPETVLGLSTKAKTYVYNDYKYDTWNDKLSLHTNSSTHMIYSEHALYISPLHEIREQTDFSHPNSSGATVKARVTKDDARDPSKWYTIFPGSNTTLGKLPRYHILNHEECHSLTHYAYFCYFFMFRYTGWRE